jgi:hypothetical protein
MMVMNARHHYYMFNYYNLIHSSIEEKLREMVMISYKDSIFKRKLRLRELELEEMITYHSDMFIKDFTYSYANKFERLSDKEVYEYGINFTKRKKSIINE